MLTEEEIDEVMGIARGIERGAKDSGSTDELLCCACVVVLFRMRANIEQVTHLYNTIQQNFISLQQSQRIDN